MDNSGELLCSYPHYQHPHGRQRRYAQSEASYHTTIHNSAPSYQAPCCAPLIPSRYLSHPVHNHHQQPSQCPPTQTKTPCAQESITRPSSVDNARLRGEPFSSSTSFNIVNALSSSTLFFFLKEKTRNNNKMCVHKSSALPDGPGWPPRGPGACGVNERGRMFGESRRAAFCFPIIYGILQPENQTT